MAMFTRQYRIQKHSDGEYRIQWSYVGLFWDTLQDPNSSYGRFWTFRNYAMAEDQVNILVHRQKNPQNRIYK